MNPSIFRIPTRDARDADHWAIIMVAGGLYSWFRKDVVAPANLAWITTISILSIISGALLWLRAPAAKWLGAFTFIALSCLDIRSGIQHGWTFSRGLNVLLPLVCAFWIMRINYSHKFDAETD